MYANSLTNNNKLLLVRYSDVRYLNSGLNTGLNLVQYLNGIQIKNHLAIGQLLTIYQTSLVIISPWYLTFEKLKHLNNRL